MGDEWGNDWECGSEWVLRGESGKVGDEWDITLLSTTPVCHHGHNKRLNFCVVMWYSVHREKYIQLQHKEALF